MKDETKPDPSPSPSRPREFDPRPKTRPSLLTQRQGSRTPDRQTISCPESSTTAEKLRLLLPSSTTDEKTRPVKLRTTTESLQRATLDASSPPGRGNDAIGDEGEFLTESRLMKMISPFC